MQIPGRHNNLPKLKGNRLPKKPGFYKDQGGDDWYRDGKGHWYDKTGTTYPRIFNLLLQTRVRMTPIHVERESR